MQLMADGLLIAAAATAAIYCLVLSRRLRSLNDAGAGIAEQIRTLDRTLADTRVALKETQARLSDLKGSARVATEKLSREVWLAKEAIAEISVARASAASLLADGSNDANPMPASKPVVPDTPTSREPVAEDEPLAEIEDIIGFDPLAGDAPAEKPAPAAEDQATLLPALDIDEGLTDPAETEPAVALAAREETGGATDAWEGGGASAGHGDDQTIDEAAPGGIAPEDNRVLRMERVAL